MPVPPALLRQPRSPRTVVVWLALWLASVGNLALWRELWRIGGGTPAFFVALGVAVFVVTATVALLALLAWGRWWKPVWIAVVIAAGVAQHFMLTYGVVMDTTMLANTMQTDAREVRDLIGWAFAGNVLAVAALPALLLLVVPVKRTPWWPQLWKNLALFVAAVAATALTMFAMYGSVAPMVRNNMHLRYIVNPIAGLTSAATVGLGPLLQRSGRLVPIGSVALGPSYAASAPPPLLVVVVGETARADHFTLNGYQRNTTPELARLDVLSFREVRSCGTDTRDSVPCMFSPLTRDEFVKRKAEHENLLDLLQAAGLALLWIENQSGCKEVCARATVARTSDLTGDAAARLCHDGECFDDALLVGLDARIARLPEERRRRGIVLVMHQMGSHGPAYFKRSPPSLKRFLPECTNLTLGRCDPAELVNAYDNTIATTDHVLAATIAWLKSRTGSAPGLLYMSDHGESLGELGIFLHGLPFSLAPEVQKRIPFVAWLGDSLAARSGTDVACLRGRLDVPLSHDNLFHTVVGLLDLETSAYRAALDAFAPCRKAR
ncbi:MAG: phosphoethanolamine transferase [Caldimonas sp.]